MFTVSDSSPYTRISLGHTGKLRILSWDNSTSSWRLISEEPKTNKSCVLYASCGPFGYCDYMGVVPLCWCLDGFEHVDGLNLSRGCRRKEALECPKENQFVALPGMRAPDKFLHIRNILFVEGMTQTPIHSLFHLPLSQQAHAQLLQLQMDLDNIHLTETSDSWSYIWGTSFF